MKNTTEKNKTFSWQLCGSPRLLFLIVCYVTLMLSNFVLIYKLVAVGPGLAPGGLFLLPFWLLIEDVIAEVYGYKISRLLIWLVLLSTTLFTTLVLVIIHLPSPPYWHLQADYDVVFDSLLRAIPAYFIGIILVSQFINIFLITKLKILVNGRFFWMRIIFSNMLSGATGVIIAFLLAYVGSHLTLASIKQLILTDYSVRFLYVVFGGGPAWLLVRYLKKKENIDVYDINTNFNPFKLSLKDSDEQQT
jgi:hypothetical protein